MPHEPQPNDETGSSAHSGDTNIVEISSGGRSGPGTNAKKSAASNAKKGAGQEKKRPATAKKRPASKPRSAAARRPGAKDSGSAATTPGPPPPLPPEFVGPRPTGEDDLVIPPRPDLPQASADEIPPKPALPTPDAEGSTAEETEAVQEASKITPAADSAASADEPVTDEHATEEPVTDDQMAEETSAEASSDGASDEPSVEDTPATDAPTDDVPAEETPADEVPAAEAPDVPADEAPAGEGLADDAPVGEAPTDDVRPEDATLEDSTADERADHATANDIDSDPAAVALASVLGDDADEPDGADGAMLTLRGVSKRFGETRAVEGIDLTIPAGTFYGLVGPNGAGKTTTLSMIAGLLAPDKGDIRVGADDLPSGSRAAKRLMGVLPDRLRTFDRLTGRQLLYYYGVLRGLKPALVESRTVDLARVFDLTDALGRVVADYSAGMLKKIMLAGAMIHSPRVLVLDEPFEAVDPVSSSVILDILTAYVDHGGTVILSSHGMDLVERVCTRLAVIVAGQVLAEGTIDEVRGELTLEQRFMELAGGIGDVEGLEWLHTFSD
ncbi:hypothetical protein GCM10009796_09170 [Microbacterium koreense]